jgi:subtilase family serine protease
MLLGRAATVALAVAILTSSFAILPRTVADRAPVTTTAHPILTDARLVPTSVPVRDVPVDQPMQLGFTLGYSHPALLAAFLSGVQNPASTTYRHFLSYSDFEREFAPAPASVASVEATLVAAGATNVGIRPGSATVEASMTAGTVEAVLGVRPVEFPGASGSVGFSVVGALRLPASLAPLVVGVEGLSGRVAGSPFVALDRFTPIGPSPSARLTPQFVLDEPSGTEWFVGSDFTQAYEATALFPGNVSSVPHATYPFHVSVATLLASSYNLSYSTPLPPFDPSVVDQYFTDTLGPGWPTPNLTGVPVPVSGVPLPPAPGSFGPLTDSIGMEAENSLDLEMAGSLAPGASLYNFYFAGSLVANPTALGAIAGYLADDLAAALSHSYGSAPLAVVSCSFGLDDLNNSAWDAELVEAAATGVTVVASSGDQGNEPAAASGRNLLAGPLWPATVGYNTSGVLSVGGVSLSLAGTPTSHYSGPPVVAAYDPNVQGLGWTSVWFDTSAGFGSFAGSEGGVSGVYDEPYWQFHSAAQPAVVQEAELQGVSSLGRAGPDIALPANTTIAYIAGSSGGAPYSALVSGTSIASPVFAGLLADVVGVESAGAGRTVRLGYFDPELYRLASYFSAYPGPDNPFVDVVNGSNAVFAALPGWDAVTGWGGLLAPLLLAADQNATERNYTYTGPTPTLPPRASSPLSAPVLLAIGVGGALAVAIVVLVYRRREPAVRPPDIFDPFLVPPAYTTNPNVAAPAFATFSCPYCGVQRPAEAGPCPSCGVS